MSALGRLVVLAAMLAGCSVDMVGVRCPPVDGGAGSAGGAPTDPGCVDAGADAVGLAVEGGAE